MSDKVWLHYGLTGLKITNDKEGFEDPIFGDATLVSADRVHRLIQTKTNEEARDVAAAYTGLTSIKDLHGESTPLPDKWVSAKPDSFVALQRRPDTENLFEEHRSRAMELAAMLGLSYGTDLMNCSIPGMAFQAVPMVAPAQFAMAPDGTWLQSKLRLEGKDTFPKEPLQISKKAFRRAYRFGKAIETDNGQWMPNESNEFVKILSTCSTSTSIEKTTKDIARKLLKAHHTPDTSGRVSRAITCLELLLQNEGGSQWTRVKRRLKALMITNQQSVKPVFDARDAFVHEGKEPSEKHVTGALGIASMALRVFAGIGTELGSKPETLEYLDYVAGRKNPDRTLSEANPPTKFKEMYPHNPLKFLNSSKFN